LSGGERALCIFIGGFKVQTGHRYFSVFHLINDDYSVVVVPLQDVIAPLSNSDATDVAYSSRLALDFVRKLPESFDVKYFKPITMEKERRGAKKKQPYVQNMESDQDKHQVNNEYVMELRGMIQSLREDLEFERQTNKRYRMEMRGRWGRGNRDGNLDDDFDDGYGQYNCNQNFNRGGPARRGDPARRDRFYQRNTPSHHMGRARHHRGYSDIDDDFDQNDDFENYNSHSTPSHYSQTQVFNRNDTHYHAAHGRPGPFQDMDTNNDIPHVRTATTTKKKKKKAPSSSSTSQKKQRLHNHTPPASRVGSDTSASRAVAMRDGDDDDNEHF